MYPPTKKNALKRSANDLSNCVYAMFWVCVCVCMCVFFFMKAYVVGTHLNCIDKSMQFKWVPTTYSRTSMARTSLGPWKFVRDMGSWSH